MGRAGRRWPCRSWCAVVVYSMPIGQAGDAALEGAVFGFWPIMWIVINALWIYNMTDSTGHFAVLRRAFAAVSDDLRIQVVMIAFCFGALLEALAGFGTPVAICGMMLDGHRGEAGQARRPWRSWLTQRRSHSARSRSRSSRLVRSLAFRCTTSARWSGARRRFWPASSRSCSCSWSTAGAGCARAGPPL